MVSKKHIKCITYEELKKFHNTFYHPSNSLFFFYGNQSIDKHLEFIEKNCLKNFSKAPPIEKIPNQKRFTAPKDYEKTFSIPKTESLEKKSILSFGYLTTHIKNQKDTLALQLLDCILMDNDASILRYALLQSKLCSQCYSFIDVEMNEIPWVFICKGSDDKNLEKMHALIQETLASLTTIPKELIEASMHQMEFGRSEISTGAQFGLQLFYRAGLTKQHGCIPEDALKIHALFEELRKDLKDPKYLPSLIKKYLLDNTHLVRLSLKPDPELEKTEALEETEKLQAIKDNLTEEEKNQIVKQGIELQKYQQSLEEQSIECLPKLEIKDVPKTPKDYPLEEKSNGFNVYSHNCFTNHIVYADLEFPMPQIEEKDFFATSLFSSFLTEVGAKNRSYQENLQYIQAHTGSMHSSISLHIQKDHPDQCKPTFSIGGKALQRNATTLFSLIGDLSTSSDFSDKNRIKELVLQEYTLLENSLASHALEYAMSLSSTSLSIPSKIMYELDGIGFYRKLKKLVSNIDDSIDELIASFEKCKNTLLSTKEASLVLSTDHKQDYSSLDALSLHEPSIWEGDYSLEPKENKGLIFASPVSYTCSTFKTEINSAALLVGAKLMENHILHPKIREQGGAYGAKARYSPLQGLFSLTTYRDPHLASSIFAFEEAILQIGKSQFNKKDLDEAKLGIFQLLDRPIAPGARGIVAFGWKRSGLTFEKRKELREKLFSLTEDDIAKAVQENLSDTAPITTTLGGKELLQKDNDALKSSRFGELKLENL